LGRPAFKEGVRRIVEQHRNFSIETSRLRVHQARGNDEDGISGVNRWVVLLHSPPAKVAA
jgi:hypothetical protein